MGESRVFSCDVCGVQKGQVNHWWICMITKQAMLNSPSCHTCTLTDFHFDLWKHYPDQIELALACGEEHAQQLFSRWLVSGSFTKEKSDG